MLRASPCRGSTSMRPGMAGRPLCSSAPAMNQITVARPTAQRKAKIPSCNRYIPHHLAPVYVGKAVRGVFQVRWMSSWAKMASSRSRIFRFWGPSSRWS